MIKVEQNVTADIRTHLNSGSFKSDWHIDSHPDEDLRTALSRASKQGTGQSGYPDLLYINRQDRLLLLVEVKPDIKRHHSAHGDSPQAYAKDGIEHYLRFFFPEELEQSSPRLSEVFDGWKIFGVAFAGGYSSGDYLISTHMLRVDLGEIVDIEQPRLLTEAEYIALHSSLSSSDYIADIDDSSKKLNEWLRRLDSQKRPILLSALMICLLPRREANADFRNSYRGVDAGRSNGEQCSPNDANRSRG